MMQQETGEKRDASPDIIEPQPQRQNPSAAQPGAPRSRRRIVLLAVAAVIATGAYLAWRAFFATPKLPESIVALSGRIEGDDSAIASKTSGRILEIRFREGDRVKAGDIIAVLSDEQVRAREEQARSAVLVAEAKGKASRDQIAVLAQQLEQNQLQTAQSKIDADGRVRQAEGELAAAEATLAQQEASYQIAAFDRDAYAKLAQTGAASERQAKQAASTAGQQEAAVAAARRRVESARGALITARANLDNPIVREAQVSIVRKQIAQQQAEVASADATTEQARGQLREAQANRRDLVILAPFSGVVATRTAEPGEVVTAGTALVTLIDLGKVYLRGFVPEGQIGKVKLGQAAHVYLDSNSNQPIDAYVARIDPQATFTPENTYFRDERVKQVVGVKLQLKGGFGFAKPGMPADGEILTQGDVWPQTRRTK
ncbi:MAG TPA: HlyD family efflux transporter periplasmic adaptor subunit [Bryobacteraceae bacterium]|nr:HlyD family efflux transporter periplasmic adaptor subunit [Bryobacteraceae bacterium]